MKKFIDFEIVLCLTIAILVGTFAFCINKTVPLDSIIPSLNITYISLLTFVSLLSFIVVNIVYIIVKISQLINYIINKALYNDYLTHELGSEDFNIYNYDLILANALYYSSSRIDNITKQFETFFKNENYLLENNSINKSKLNELLFCEKSMLIFFSNTKDFDVDFYDIETQLTSKLKEKNLIYFSSFKLLLNSFLRGKNNRYITIDFAKNYNFLLLEFFAFVIIALIIQILGFNLAIIFMPFVVIFTILNMNRIFLTKQGRIEKARIIQYKKSLKNKIDLTAREKLFLELLQK